MSTLIVSKFKDYYDECLINKGTYPIWNRKTIYLESSWINNFSEIYKYYRTIPQGVVLSRIIEDNPYPLWITAGVVGICGWLYPVWAVRGKGVKLHACSFDYLIRKIKDSDFNAIDSYWKCKGLKDELIENLLIGNRTINKKELDNINPLHVGEGVFGEINSPIFSYKVDRINSQVKVNPRLDVIGVDKIIDGKRMASLIDNFLSRVLSVRRETREVYITNDNTPFLSREEAKKYAEHIKPQVIDLTIGHDWKKGDVAYLKGYLPIQIVKVDKRHTLVETLSRAQGRDIYQLEDVIYYYAVESTSRIIHQLIGRGDISLLMREVHA
ncbi:hypothetical protein H6G33_10265 [Calothrix sp. FACHB-1219]|uniref:hypothetical protein n=1 Tax=unclassified Calothrix TaxID=2619626 RepID=UPI001683DCCB|nr:MULTISPECIES: hypothetical protein [unclassified Calothrix]MBD2201731.1 hypothetical protein [Calothrix sp. FACHB-168]MBD2217417.1 hypothetical protein [Calothrix sp. FACHB-1219]